MLNMNSPLVQNMLKDAPAGLFDMDGNITRPLKPYNFEQEPTCTQQMNYGYQPQQMYYGYQEPMQQPYGYGYPQQQMNYGYQMQPQMNYNYQQPYGYPQQPIQQQMYYGYQEPPKPQCDYSRYTILQPTNPEEKNYPQIEYYYDPMPNVVCNPARGIYSQKMINPQVPPQFNNPAFNAQAFVGYSNPVLSQKQTEIDRIGQKQEAIAQGNIWRTLFKGAAFADDPDFNPEETATYIESLYYTEPYVPEMTPKEQMVVEKNNHIAQVDAAAEYCKANNIPMLNNLDLIRANFYAYYDHIYSVVGDISNCGMMEYFNDVYPLLVQDELLQKARKTNKNRKNNYKTNEFNTSIKNNTNGNVLIPLDSIQDMPDSFVAKLAENFADNGIKICTSDGLTITKDGMEITMPERLLKNRQKQYYEQRREFYDKIFNKGEV